MGDHGPSIKKPRMYEALRRKGYSKAKAARISNAAANGTLDRHGHGGGKKMSALALQHSHYLATSGATSAGRQGRGGRSNASYAVHGRRGGGSARGNASVQAGRVTRGRSRR